MKFAKLGIALAVASTLTACGGGSTAESIATITTTPVVTPPVIVQQVLNEVYVNDMGGPIDLTFTPTSLPTWIKLVNGKYQVDANDCSNRFAELTNSQNKQTVVQTSKFQCTLGDFNSAANLNFNEGSGSYFWWETTGPVEQRVFSPTIVNRSISKVDGSAWPKKRGGDQLMFEVRKGDCTGNDCTRIDGARDRAEFAYSYESNPNPTEPGWRPNFNQDYWVNFSFYVPRPYKEQGNQPGTSTVTTLFQIISFHVDSNNNPNWYPALQIGKLYNGNLVARTWPTADPYIVTTLIDDANFEGHWHDIQVKYRAWVPTNDSIGCMLPICFSEDSTSTIEVWVNGLKKLEFKKKSIMKKESSIYLKFGLYRPASEENITQQIYFDEFRIGKTREEVYLK